MPYLLPTSEELERARLEINPTFRTMQAFWNYINSDRGTMGQEILASRDESEYWDEPVDDDCLTW